MPTDAHPPGPDPGEPDDPRDFRDRQVFEHPQWMLGVVLILAGVTIVAGLGNPIWLLIGSPFLLVLVVYLRVWWTRR